MTDNSKECARTRAWKRLRKLLGLPGGTERRAVLQAAADEIERLRLNAAAPELYAALDTLTCVVGLAAIKYPGQMAVLQERLAAARAVLAKAQGEVNDG